MTSSEPTAEVLHGFLCRLPSSKEKVEFASAKPILMDSSLPHLEVARDPDAMRDVFQEHLRSLDGRSYQVLKCMIYNIRYRQDISCLIQYKLRLAEPAAGSEWNLFVTGSMHAMKDNRHVCRRLQASRARRGHSAAPSIFAPAYYIRDLGMLVQVFPYDRQLRTLPLLIEGMPPDLEALLLAQFGPGNWRTEEWAAEPVRYLAEKRATLRLTIRALEPAIGRAERRFYAKVYSNRDEGKQTYRILKALRGETSDGREHFGVVRPIAYLGNLRTLLLEEVRGTSLWDILLREDDPTLAVRRTARAMADLHLSRMVTKRRHLLLDEIASLQNRRKLLQRTCPRLTSKIENIVGAVIAELEDVPPVPTHRDFKPEDVIVDDERVVMLDLDVCADADPMLDVALFLAHLYAMPHRTSLVPARALAAARTFTDEYFSHAPKTWHDRLAVHYAAALLRIAAGSVRSQEQGWPDKVEAFVEEARNSVWEAR